MNNWDNLWSDLNISPSRIEKKSWEIHHKRVFKIYKKFLRKIKIKNPKIVELGCGSGELTARLIKKCGGTATLIDNSKEALKLAARNFENQEIKAKFLLKDVFKYKPKEKFDIVHSEGLIEHFIGKKQKEMIEAHKRFLKKNGFIIITVPRPAWYYKIWKWFLEKTNRWPFGFEKALNKYELKKILEDCELKVLDFFEYSRYSFALAKI